MTEDRSPQDDLVSRETDQAGGAALHEVSDAELDLDAVRAFLGASHQPIAEFHGMLVAHGEERGLIGPRELDRLWIRHLLNSAAVTPYLPATGMVVDLGSGAGLPGIVVAAMLPDAHVILVEPMERRCAWLAEVIERLGLSNVEVRRGRAEEFHGAFEADAVTARAVAALDKLGRWAFPLLARGGVLVALKGRSASDEIAAATKMLRRYGATDAEVLTAGTLPGVPTTAVVRATRTR